MMSALALLMALEACGTPEVPTEAPEPAPEAVLAPAEAAEPAPAPQPEATPVPTASDGLPLVVVDEAHRFVKALGTGYAVPPGDAIHLDLSGIELRTANGDGPNAIHMMFGRPKLYRFDWPDSDQLVLSADTAQPIYGSVPWPGFQDRTVVMLAIGIEQSPGEVPGFTPLWVTNLEVKGG